MPDRENPPDLDIYWVNQYAVPPDQPGGTRHFDFAVALGERGHRVHLVASDLNLTTRQYSRRRRALDLRRIREDVNGVEFTWLSAGAYRGNDWRRVASMIVFGVLVFVHLLFVPKGKDKTVFIGSSPHLFAALGTWAAARLRRVPFVLEVRDLWPESYAEVAGKDSGPEISLMRRIADLLYKQARAIIVLAEANAEHIVSRGVDRTKITYVPNGVDLDGFLDGVPAVDLASPGVFTFVYAGAHGPANDLATVVRACSSLSSKGRNNIRVVLIGDGPTKQDLKRLAEALNVSNVEFEDPMPKAMIGPTLATADAGLMVLAPVDLFTYGVSPNKLFDYLAAGLPVVSNVPGLVSEIVQTAGVGLCIEAGNAEALARAMAQVADCPPSECSVRGPSFIRNNFDRRTLAVRIENAIDSALH